MGQAQGSGEADVDHALDPILSLVTLQRRYGPHNLIKFTIAEPWGTRQAKTDKILRGPCAAGGLCPPLLKQSFISLPPGYLGKEEASNRFGGTNVSLQAWRAGLFFLQIPCRRGRFCLKKRWGRHRPLSCRQVRAGSAGKDRRRQGYPPARAGAAWRGHLGGARP